MTDYIVHKNKNTVLGDNPEITVILPVYGRSPYLDVTLASIQGNTYKKYELVIVADCLDKERENTIKSHNPDVFINAHNRLGLSKSRNLAAEYARGKILFFTDDDIKLPQDCFEKIHTLFKDNSIHCLIGVYSLRDGDTNLCTLYKNSWIRFSYLKSPKEVSWFFTAVGAIKKEDWIASAHFQAEYNRKIGGEDIEFGLRLSQNGKHIMFEKKLEVTHLRNYSFYDLLYNDLCRAYGYTLIGCASRKNFLHVLKSGIGNISHDFIASSVLAGLFVVCLCFACLNSEIIWETVGILIIYFILNISFYHYIRKNFSLMAALKCMPLMMLDHFVCCCGVTAAVFKKLVSAVTSKIFLKHGQQ